MIALLSGVSEMSRVAGAGLTAPLLRVEIAEAPGRLEHPVVVGAAARADAKVDRGAREALAGVLAAQLQLDVLVHDRDAGVAARITLLGAQQLVELVQVGHARASSSLSGWPAAARLARSLRRASKRFL